MSKNVEMYGCYVFDLKTMKKYLTKEVFTHLQKTIKEGGILEQNIADQVAEGMKKWALEHKASHFCHWFQPLTGKTAAKQTSFICPQHNEDTIFHFSGRELVQGEADASSFPSGGLRFTHEARGYTAWDPTSFAFIKEGINGNVLCIPTIFCGYYGEALDKKLPLIRSKQALVKQLIRLGKLLKIKEKMTPYVTLGGEQEYFLIDRDYYYKRTDLIQTGRTLFGVVPAKHQQLEDHYFGVIKPKILAFMNEVDQELWKLGIPAKTRHNEVAPSQFEIVPVFEELNLAIDHNMIIMEMLSFVAEKHNLACLLHEKPFAGVNGSGKHNNWSIMGTDGKNWLSYGDSFDEHVRFVILIGAIIKAVDEYAGILRASVASIGNDHRLGANEAPPAIISIFLGDKLFDILQKIAKEGIDVIKKESMKDKHDKDLCIPYQDANDRNRTAPFAFTGNKFEFRSVGSSMNMSEANTVLNSIVADSLDYICTRLEKKEDFSKILRDIIKEHGRILFNGNNYSDEWRKEAKKRGLANLDTTLVALPEMITNKAIKLFAKHDVFSEKELKSHYEAAIHTYWTKLVLEVECAVNMVRMIFMPAILRYQNELLNMHVKVKEQKVVEDLLNKIAEGVENMGKALIMLEKALKGKPDKSMLDGLKDLRLSVDNLEKHISWPLPSYAEMLLMMK
jgi:glutamine synthetase